MDFDSYDDGSQSHSEAVNLMQRTIRHHSTTNAFFLNRPSKITSMLYIGSGADARNIENLKALGVTHVLNCASSDVSTGTHYYAGDGIKYYEINANDADNYGILSKHKEECFAFLDSCKSENGKVIVHCLAGVNRSVTIATAFLLKDLQLPLCSVLKIVATSRGHVLSNLSFCSELVEYSAHLGLPLHSGDDSE